MELFSELYSCYYQVVARILRAAERKPLPRREIARMIDQQAFAESGLYLLPRLCGGEWELLDETPDGYASKTAHLPRLPVTDLQAAWIRAVLADPRARLFFTNSQLAELDEHLRGVEPLFSLGDFREFDVCLDGDDYADEGYRERFGRILRAIRERTPLKFHYRSPKAEEPIVGDYLPCKLEYSQKDDKFRLYAARLAYGCVRGIQIINLGRIVKLESSRQTFRGEVDLDGWLRRSRCAQPVILRIFRERNALERCMLHFANYEKRTEYEEKTDSYRCIIYYDLHDETELLIRVLSFGPVVQVLGPEPFLRQVRDRVRRQYVLLYGETK